MSERTPQRRCSVAVIWIDWYKYHVARFRGLIEALPGSVAGIELVGGFGVHAGLKFRETLPSELPIHTLMPDKSWSEAGQFQLVIRLWRKLSELDPEMVLVPGYYTLPGIASALWARLHGAQSVLMTESTAQDHARIGWKERFKSVVLRTLFDWAVTGGIAHVEYLQKLGFPMDRITGFYDVVDNSFFREGTTVAREERSASAVSPLPDGSPYFLFVGRLASEKNVAALLSSWKSYRRAGGTWPLVLVGDGPEATALKTQAAASGFGNEVHFPGLRSSQELLPFYAFAGCFVIPSIREPWGLVVNEAMASGLPVLVSSHCGCSPDLVTAGGNGFTFDPGDENALTTLLHRIEGLTVEDRTSMGKQSAKIIDLFSPYRFGLSICSIADATGQSGLTRSLSGGPL